jgi:hypothetical protein
VAFSIRQWRRQNACGPPFGASAKAFPQTGREALKESPTGEALDARPEATSAEIGWRLRAAGHRIV